MLRRFSLFMLAAIIFCLLGLPVSVSAALNKLNNSVSGAGCVEGSAELCIRVLTQIAPVLNEVVHSASPTFIWEVDPEANEYLVKIRGETPAYKFKFKYTEACNESTCSVVMDFGDNPMPNDAELEWRVIGKDKLANPPYENKTDWQVFFTEIPGKAHLTSPASGAIISTLAPEYTWSQVPNATSYKLTVQSTDKTEKFTGNFDQTSCDAIAEECSATLADPLTDGKSYTWKIITKGTGDYKSKSVKNTFTVTTAPPSLALPSGSRSE